MVEYVDISAVKKWKLKDDISIMKYEMRSSILFYYEYLDTLLLESFNYNSLSGYGDLWYLPSYN